MKKKAEVISLICELVLLILLSVGIWIYYNYTLQQSGFDDLGNMETYENHYVLIADSPSSPFWQSVYNSGAQEAKSQGAYLELLGPDSQSEYAIEDMMRIAIAESVDGILLQYTGGEQLKTLIDQAVEKNIPVITIAEDASDSQRQSFVGVNIFQLGKAYGEQVASLITENTQKILVLIRNNEEGSVEKMVSVQINNAVIQAQKEGQNIEVELREVSGRSSFDAEEMIRNIVLEEQDVPDILVCLDEVDTECAYQALIDYNEVGKMNIVGYYSTNTILEGIKKNIIPVTIELDAYQMGTYGINALEEYKSEGRVSDYYSINVNVITPQNVQEYINEDENGV